MHTLLMDLRYGVRMLLKNPGVTTIAVLTLALGIGANTAIFSVVNGVLLRPLPYKNPDRLMSLWEVVPEQGRWRVAPANFLDWKNQNTVFEDMSAFGGATMTLTGDGEPAQLAGTRVSAGYFSVLGVGPILGREFSNDEFEPGKGQVVVLAESLWKQRYGGDPQVINRTITLNGANFTVIGVMPAGLYPARPVVPSQLVFEQDQQQFWLPMAFAGDFATYRQSHILGVLGRLKEGKTLAQAQSEMNTIAARLAQEIEANKGAGVVVGPFVNEVVGDVRPALLTLLAAVGIVLLIACANVAGLLLAQHAARAKEVAIRVALGASRPRLIRQFFLEGAILSLAGTLIGFLTGRLGMSVILKFIPGKMPRLDQITVDYRVLLFTLGVSVLTCWIFGLAPAWQASKTDLQKTLEQSGRTSGPAAGRKRLRQLLIIFQVSMAVMLAIGAGLLLKSFWLLQKVDPGFKAEQLLSLGISLPASKYKEPEQINNFFNQLNESVSNLAGVQSEAIAYDRPLESNWLDSFSVEGVVTTAGSESSTAAFMPVSWDYFHTVGAQVLSGREFTPTDDPSHPGVAIVNEAFTRRYFPGEKAIGRRIKPGPPQRIWRGQRLTSFEIVGVVRNIKSSGLKAETEPAYYLPSSQAPLQDMVLLVRTSNEPTSIAPAIRKAVLSIDPNQPISDVSTLERVVSDNIAQPKLNMILMALFGAIALILAAVGLYGLMSYSVTQRTQELGVRIALGAQVTDVLKLVLGQGMALAFVGEGIGLFGAFVLTRLLQNLLFGVTPTDATIFIVVVGFLTTVALLACYLPARRATKVDPLIALRYE